MSSLHDLNTKMKEQSEYPLCKTNSFKFECCFTMACMPDAHLLDDYMNGTRRRSTDVALCSQVLRLASCDRQLDVGSVCITLLQRMKGGWGGGGL